MAPSVWGGEPVHVSPDGRRLFVVTRRGDIASDSNIYRLLVFDVSTFDLEYSADRHPEPVHTVTFQSETNAPAISDARWTDNGGSVALLGVQGPGEAQVYRLNVDTGQVAQITDVPLGVYAYDVQAGSLVYFARVAVRPDAGSSYYPARFLDRSYIWFFDRHWIGDTFATFVSFRGGVPRQVGPSVSYPYPIIWTTYRLSPDGRYAMMTEAVPPGSAPPNWDRYRAPAEEAEAARAAEVRAQERYLQRYKLLDVQRAEARTTFDAPTGQAVENDGAVVALWHPDSSRVLLTNVCLPLDRDADHRRDTSYIIEYTPARDSYRVVDAVQTPRRSSNFNSGWLRDVEWMTPGQTFLVRYRAADTVTGGREYSRTASAWSSRDAARELLERRPMRGGYSAAIRESADQPPMLFVHHGERVIDLFPADPALAGLALDPVQAFSWSDARGNVWSGALSVPRGREQPLPLVIQITTGADFDHFQPEGTSTTSHAAQSLNSVGIAVLRVRMSDVRGFGTADEGPSFIAGIDAAVSELSRRGSVDHARVGLLGHSRGGYLTQLAITHPTDVVLSAAIAADAFSGGYFEYMNMDRESASRSVYEGLYGGPFWENISQWLELAPTFNAHRAQTPLLLVPIGPPALLGTQELYASLRLNRKPVDLLYFPSGEHQLVRPSERLASITATVDWMRFWLQSYEDPDPGKGEQYARWRKLRELQEANRTPERPKPH